MRFWLLAIFPVLAWADAGTISELRGLGEVLRQTDKLLASLELNIDPYDDVRTGNGRLAITFLDDSTIRLTEHSKIVIDEFVYDANPSRSKLALNMASGTARFITGRLGRIKKENIFIKTPSATIGIRGTDFTATVDELGRSLIILLPNEDGSTSGSISVTTWSGTEILDKPFQATMASAIERPPTKPVVLNNVTLDLIDNMLIVNRPKEIEEAETQQQKTSSATLDQDFFEDVPDLDQDFLEEKKEVTRLDVDLLSFDFLVDVLALAEKAKSDVVSELGNVRLTGIVPGFDPELQTYTFIEGPHLYFVHSGANTFDVGLDKSQAGVINVNSADTLIDVEVNGASDNSITIFQSP